jgi:hypothetical protein
VDDTSGALLTTCDPYDKFTVSSENVKTFSEVYLILLKFIGMWFGGRSYFYAFVSSRSNTSFLSLAHLCPLWSARLRPGWVRPGFCESDVGLNPTSLTAQKHSRLRAERAGAVCSAIKSLPVSKETHNCMTVPFLFWQSLTHSVASAYIHSHRKRVLSVS